MNNTTTQTSVSGLNPEFAWKLWHQLNKAAEALWELYEQEFLQFCIDECDVPHPEPPLPFENDYDKKAA